MRASREWFRGARVEEDTASRRHCVEKTLYRVLVLAREPTMCTKVAWAEPEHAGKQGNSKSTGEVEALTYSRAMQF
jgi:hypothetical protein